MKLVLLLWFVGGLAAGCTTSSAPRTGTTAPLTGSHLHQSYRQAGMITDASAPVVIIERQWIDRSGVTSLTQILRNYGHGH